jgi:hypothetical protein
MKSFKKVLKTDPYREPTGTPKGGEFAHNPNLPTVDSKPIKSDRIFRHNTRYNFVIERHKTIRLDLGHFKNKFPREITSLDAVMKDKTWLAAEDKLISTLSTEEKDKLTEFTGPGMYSRLNRDLAAGKTRDPELVKSAKILQRAVLKSTIPEDITLFRGMHSRGAFLEGEAAIGKVYDSATFQSSSLLQDNALQFTTGREPACLLRIKAKAGQIGAYLDGKMSKNPHEQEVLFPAKAKFLITGHSILEVGRGKNVTKMHLYDVEYL